MFFYMFVKKLLMLFQKPNFPNKKFLYLFEKQISYTCAKNLIFSQSALLFLMLA